MGCRAGGTIESVTEGADWMRKIRQAMAVDESRQKSQTWKNVHARRVALGLSHGGPTPFGYRKAAQRDEPPTVDPVAGPIVEQLYADYLAGVGPRTLVQRLNEAGVRTTRGNAWSLSPLIKLLDGGFAAGRLRVDSEWVRGAHEALVDSDTWARYRRERERRRVVHPKQRQPERWYLGGGLAVCEDCGGPLSLNRYAEPSYARCTRRLHQGAAVCPGNEIKRMTLDTLVALWLLQRQRQWADVAAVSRGVDDERARLGKALDGLRAEEERIQSGRAVAARLVASGQMPEGAYLAAKREADRDLAAVAARVAEVEAQVEALAPDRDVLDRLTRDVEGQSKAEWNAQLRKLIRELRVGRTAFTLVPWQGEPATYDRADLQPKGARRRGPNGRYVGAAAVEPEWPDGLAIVLPEGADVAL